MSNLATGALGILLVAAFLLFLAFATKSIAFGVVVAIGMACMLADLIGSIRDSRAST